MSEKISEFLDRIINYESVHDILNSYKEQNVKGSIFESLFNILIKLGYCPLFPYSNYNHLVGNFNLGQLSVLTNIQKYFEESNMINGKRSGSSDISLKNKNTDSYVFISSKYSENTDRAVNAYDISEIQTIAKKYNYEKYKIMLLVYDKEKVLQKAKRADKASLYNTEHIKDENVLDIKDLNQYFLAFKNDIKINKRLNYEQLDSINLRFHQTLIVNSIAKKMNDNKNFLIACKPRSGKTYICAGIISKLQKNALIITPIPTETYSEFKKVFYQYKEFSRYKIHVIDSSKTLKSCVKSENNIFITSKQLLQGHIKEKIGLFDDIDLLFFDENHFSGTTELSEQILSVYSHKCAIYLTATYNKPLLKWNIQKDCQYYWDIECEHICKKDSPITELSKLFNEVEIIDTLNQYVALGYSEKQMFESYQSMPDLYLISSMFESEHFSTISSLVKNSVYGFSFENLFSLNDTTSKFNFRNDVKQFISYISGSNRIRDFPNGDKSIFGRVNKIISSTATRKPLTQIWFLPPNNINEISLELESLIVEDPVLKNYKIFIVNRKNENLTRDILAQIDNLERQVIAENKSGLIILAGNMLNLGVTLKNCDIVMLLHDSCSCDKIFQQIYRSMTEDKNKKMGFVIDLNSSRVVNTFLDYTSSKNMSLENRIKYVIQNNLINIDADIFTNKTLDSNVIIKKVLEIWKSNPKNSYNKLVVDLHNEIITLDKESMRLLHSNFNKTKYSNIEIDLYNENQEIDNGRIIERESVHESSQQLENAEENESENLEEFETINFTRDVLHFIIPFACLLTLEEQTIDLIEMLLLIKDIYIDVFNEQCFQWWNCNSFKKTKFGLIEFIIKNIEQIDKKNIIFILTSHIKICMKALINKPKELLEFINACLPPKVEEKRENGEVFTPLHVIEELFDNLDNHYKKVNGSSIFANKNYKWGDISGSGIGNFSIVLFLRLMNGLSNEFPIENERADYILTNMIYMSEMNSKNITTCKRIFHGHKLNLYKGVEPNYALDLNPKLEWNIDKFDVIVGNPPYNSGGIKSHTGKHLGEKNETIWPRFINKSLELLREDGYLVYITPLSWLKKSHDNHSLLENHVIWLKLWDNIKSLSVIKGKIPISLFIMQNRKNVTKSLTHVISEVQSKKLITSAEVYLDPSISIPIAYHSIFEKLYNFIQRNGLQLEYNTKTVKSSGTKQKLPENYTLEDKYAVDTYTIKDGLQVKKADVDHVHAKVPKLIIANKSSFRGTYLDDGRLSLTGYDKTYILGDNLDTIKEMLEYKICEIISHYTKYRQDFLEREVYVYLPDIRKLGKISEEELYDRIGLTKEEKESFGFVSKEKPTEIKPKPYLRLRK